MDELTQEKTTLKDTKENIQINDVSLDPHTDVVIGNRIQVPYITSAPTIAPSGGSPSQVVYSDGTDYYLSTYANGGWRSVKLSISGINARAYGFDATTVAASNTPTKISLNTQNFANGITYSQANDRFTIVTAGQYIITGSAGFGFSGALVDGKIYTVMIYVNNNEVSRASIVAGAASLALIPKCVDILNLNVGDYVELWAQQGDTSTINVSGTSAYTYLALAKV